MTTHRLLYVIWKHADVAIQEALHLEIVVSMNNDVGIDMIVVQIEF